MKTMEAGPELDALVADKVMGQTPCLSWFVQRYTELGPIFMGGVDCGHRSGGCFPDGNAPKYSTDIAAAWAVVERFQSSKAWCAPYLTPVGGDGSAGNPDGWIASFDYGMPDAVFGATAPLAICLAALKAVGVDVEQLDAERYPLSRGD